ncbi:MAG: glycosyltransferase family 1 protein, partial [Polyangiaceae bacterium]|nr:glycosyltransferase family 1 protein [Polyangiaceae bacterium]
GFELEDVITEVDDVDIVRVRYPAGGSGSLVNRALRRVGRLAGLEVGRHVRIERPKLEHEYDMIFIGLTGCMHLTKYEPFIREWKDKARLVVCYIEELWKGWLGHDELIAPLASFDHVLLGCSGTVSALADAIGRPVTYFSPAIDMDRFCPYPNAPRRTIDVRSMGRRSARTHVALREWAEETGATYLYDANTVEVPVLRDPAAYRVHTAEVLKRSRYFLVNPAKIDRPEDTGGQQEIGLRFYEGAGAGCVLVGQSPRCEAFERNFDWKDAIIEVPYDSSDVTEVLRALDSDPERVARIRVENVAQCLERHDWVHRWFHSLGQLGMLPREAALGRR